MKNLLTLFAIIVSTSAFGQRITSFEKVDSTINGIGFKTYFKITLDDNSKWLVEGSAKPSIGLNVTPKTYPWREIEINGIVFSDYSNVTSK